ncbi:type IVB secretion system protein IcmH/DotU [Campylobacter helveticus]|nr:type IVB secretion system protein IcmH/DotU [Campylobacter helveticus]ARE80311.1 type VI secretion system, membrane platform protein [Campylobacter helveticus]MCR2055456.1 type IVB secretion system protein IcmH/DotU [Campylobacter helveticus]SMC24188.1 type VI secretion system protein ImpK [Campylobacter helveticus]SUW83018.1 aspartyl/glutamyl-tRNA(Asn/Gln) amidotransferase subunit B (Asp/Glu-ADT subunit B) [Campylobacter helveticus]
MRENFQDTNEVSLLLSSELSGLKNNKVIDYALELLLLTFRLSKVSSLETSAIENLKEEFVNDILTWSSKLSNSKEYDEKDIIKLRYCLCVFIDESLMKNELFMASSWANNTLTIRLFDETLGGDNFYDIALSWLNNPAKNKDFLEFIYALLVLGYKGKYSNNKDVNERILYLCNNIASSLSPLLNINEEFAFTKAYIEHTKENFWQKFQRRYFKATFIGLPLAVILLVYVYVLLDIETNNVRVDENISILLEMDKDINKSKKLL